MEEDNNNNKFSIHRPASCYATGKKCGGSSFLSPKWRYRLGRERGREREGASTVKRKVASGTERTLRRRQWRQTVTPNSYNTTQLWEGVPLLWGAGGKNAGHIRPEEVGKLGNLADEAGGHFAFRGRRMGDTQAALLTVPT